jgi:hypothetical protein
MIFEAIGAATCLRLAALDYHCQGKQLVVRRESDEPGIVVLLPSVQAWAVPVFPATVTPATGSGAGP